MAMISIQAGINAGIDKARAYYSEPAHVQQWHAAHGSWHCPEAENDLREAKVLPGIKSW